MFIFFFFWKNILQKYIYNSNVSDRFCLYQVRHAPQKKKQLPDIMKYSSFFHYIGGLQGKNS